jgi:hypothetical protein
LGIEDFRFDEIQNPKSQLPNLMLHLKRYFAALAVVVTTLATYAFGVAPWLEPPPIARKATDVGLPDVNPADPTADLLKRLFNPGDWELDQPKIVETDTCTLLVKDYQPTPDGTLALTPCTLIFYAAAAGSTERRPIVMQAPQGAFIKFDRPLNLARAEFGKLEGGRLPGQITIFSPETAPGRGDDLHLTTQDLTLTKDSIKTLRDVEFRYGESHGKGRDLTIALLPKHPEDPNSGVGGIRSITLEKIERLHIEAAGDALGGPAGGAPQTARNNAPMEVTCQGPFVFDVLAETAMFDKGVEVQRVNPMGPPDTLTCQRLLLVFADEQGAGGTGGASPSQAAPSQLSSSPAPPSQPPAQADPLAGRLKRIVAEGGPVRLVAPSSATVASAARLEYSLTKRRLVLVPGPNAEQVTLKQEANEFTARELEYESAEPGRLGRLWAAGPGQLKFTQSAGPAKQTVVARWEKELRIRPHERNQVISLVGKASLDVSPLGHFSAEELHLWVLEVPQDSKTAPEGEAAREGEAPAEPVNAAADRNPNQSRFSILPARLLASGGVQLDSPRLHVDTARLEVWFQNLPPKPQPLPPVKQPERAAPPIAPASHLQGVGLSPGRPDERAIRPPSLQKFDLTGDLIQMQVIRQGEEMELEDLMIRGHVALDESRTAEPGQQPIRIRGDSLELRGGVTGPGKFDIAGGPAEMGGRGMSLAGKEIHLVRAENRLWIDGPGEATLPSGAGFQPAMLPGAGPGTGNRGQATGGSGQRAGDIRSGASAAPVHVVWQDRFTFDGQTTEMLGDVQARSGTYVVTAKRLEASLNRRIDLAAPQTGDDTDLARLVFDGGVHVVSRTLNEHDEQTSYDQAQVKNFVMDRAAGTLHADGPGWVSSHRVATGGLPGAPLPAAPPPGAPAAPLAPPKLIYIEVTFQGSIEGLIEKRQIEFHRQVRTIFAPVSDWNQRVVINKIEDLGEQGVLMNSDTLTVVEMNPPGQRPWIEAFVTGNTIVEGTKFTVHAPRISYTSDKQLLTLEGDGRADAQLWYRDGAGQPESASAAQKWKYWLETGKLEVEGIGPTTIQTPRGGRFPFPRARP